MKDTEERKLKVYLAPKLEVVEFRVEGGFAFSGMLLEGLDKGNAYSDSDFSYRGISPDGISPDRNTLSDRGYNCYGSGESIAADGGGYNNFF